MRGRPWLWALVPTAAFLVLFFATPWTSPLGIAARVVLFLLNVAWPAARVGLSRAALAAYVAPPLLVAGAIFLLTALSPLDVLFSALVVAAIPLAAGLGALASGQAAEGR